MQPPPYVKILVGKTDDLEKEYSMWVREHITANISYVDISAVGKLHAIFIFYKLEPLAAPQPFTMPPVPPVVPLAPASVPRNKITTADAKDEVITEEEPKETKDAD